MTTRTVPGAGAQFNPIFDDEFGVESIEVLNGGSGYAATDPPKITITGTTDPLVEGVFYPVIVNGSINRIAVIERGSGYFPVPVELATRVGIATTSYVESSIVVNRGDYVSVASTESSIIMALSELSGGSAILEDGYNVAISTTVVGIAATVVPDFSFNQNAFYGLFTPFPSYATSGVGTEAKFSVFFVYNSGTGDAISTSLILREGGRGYAPGDTVSIAGTYMGGQTPANDLTFTVSGVTNTIIPAEADATYADIPSYTSVGFGTGAIFEVTRDSNGSIDEVNIVNGGVGYALTDVVGISGTYIGGSSPADDLRLVPAVLGTDKLPSTLYVDKVDDNTFQVSGLATANPLNFTSFGTGQNNLNYDNPNASALITVDNIIQAPIYKRDLSPTLNHVIGITTDIIYLSGIGSVSSTDIIQIDQEYFQVRRIGLTSETAVEVTRGYIGSKVGYHTVGAAVTVLRGDYNIEEGNIHFTAPPYGPTGFVGLQTYSTFSGRVFSRRFDPGTPNDLNLVFDDLSTQFVSASSTEFYLKSRDKSVVGVYTDTNSVVTGGIDINNNPLVLINNVPQISGTDFTVDNAGENRLRFISGSPSAGRITRTGVSTGFGYQPLVSAGATAIISGGGVAQIDIRGFGAGYRTAPMIEVISAVGSGASLTATIGAGGTITAINIVNAGTGYSVTNPPIIDIDEPAMYSDLDLEYIPGSSGNGTGAKASVVVGNANDIIGFELEEPGEYYKVGDVLRVVGIVTDTQVGAGFSEFRITVEEVLTDKFSGMYPGQFVQFDDISGFFNGFKKKFTLSVTEGAKTEILSLKVNPSSDLSMENNLFVFLNDVLQTPLQSYTFNGSRLSFTEPPKANSKCTILFYRGSDLDVEQVDPPKTVKEGDSIQIGDNILNPADRPQFERIVKRIVSADALDTFAYDSIGINTDPAAERPLRWTKQTTDRIINGVLYSKSRPDLSSRVVPTTKLIKNVRQEDEKLYVNNAFPLFQAVDGMKEDIRDVGIVDVGETNAAIATAIVSAAGTVSSISVSYGGTGYHRIDTPNVAISSAVISRKDPIFNWIGSNTGISTDVTINSITLGKPIVAVGNSGFVGFTTNGISWGTSTIGVGTESFSQINFSSVGVADSTTYVAAGTNAKLVRFTGTGTGIGASIGMKLLKEVVVLGLPDPVIEFSQYTNDFNDIVYNEIQDSWIAVGDGPGLFQGVGIGTTSFYEKNARAFNNLNGVAHNGGRYVVVGDSGLILYSTDGNFWDRVQSLASTRNFNSVTWTGRLFVAVGDNGTIFVSPHGQLNWQRVVPNITDHLYNIKYEYGVYVATNQAGQLLFSLDLTYWTYRGTNQSNFINDLVFLPAPPPAHLRGPNYNVISEEGRYFLVGAAGTAMYADPIYNRATGVSTVVNGAVSSITVVNPGFGYSATTPPPVLVESDSALNEQIYSIKAKGDFGVIKYVGVGNTHIDFILQSEQYDNSALGIGYSALNTYGVTYSQIEVGDRFVIFDSNSTVSHALTGITTNFGALIEPIGVAVSFIDGVYQAERVDATPSTGIVTVRCMFTTNPTGGAIDVNTSLNENGVYGRYTWGKIYDFQNRTRYGPKDFFVNTNNGLSGLSTAPDVYRTRGLS